MGLVFHGKERESARDYVGVQRVQTPRLYDPEEQKEHDRAFGTQKILPVLPQAHRAS
jgi:hypothetical protein